MKANWIGHLGLALLFLGLLLLSKEASIQSNYLHPLALKLAALLSLGSAFVNYVAQNLSSHQTIEPLYAYMVGFLFRLFLFLGLLVYYRLQQPAAMEPLRPFLVVTFTSYFLGAGLDVWQKMKAAQKK